jgi:hypothetical protein
LDYTGKHGKICAERDLGKDSWDNAMEKCQNLNLNGFDDWFLPSVDDLRILYLSEISHRFEHRYHWSSTKFYSYDFADGSKGIEDRSTSNYVIAIRLF